MLCWICDEKLESELKQGDDIELITANPNEGGGEDFEGSSDDYDFGTETTGEIDSAYSKCRGDDAIACSKNPHITICSDQFCDLNRDCPDGEDESIEICPPGEIQQMKRKLTYFNWKRQKTQKHLENCKKRKYMRGLNYNFLSSFFLQIQFVEMMNSSVMVRDAFQIHCVVMVSL